MKKFTVHTGIAVAIDRPNIDTDAIIPKQFLKSIQRTGFGINLFDEWRYLDHGEPGMDPATRTLNPDFPLNAPRFAGAGILVARENFGCGSSREHAVWALDDYGIRAVLAPSFSDIFFNNCFKNGLLPIRLTAAEIDQIIQLINAHEGLKIEVNLESQTVSSILDQQILHAPFSFEIDPFRKHCLIHGLDDIGLTLQHADEIRKFEAQYQARAPWIFSQN